MSGPQWPKATTAVAEGHNRRYEVTSPPLRLFLPPS